MINAEECKKTFVKFTFYRWLMTTLRSRFKTYINLVRHRKYHSGDKFSCPTCSRVYPTKSTLRAHIITHSDIRPHTCHICHKTFKRNQDLKVTFVYDHDVNLNWKIIAEFLFLVSHKSTHRNGKTTESIRAF